MPGAAQPTVLDAVHMSCRAVVDAAAASVVALEPAAIEAYAAGLDVAAARAAAAREHVQFPLKFDDLEAEVSFLALYHLLDFGSGYEPLLRTAGGRGARETIQFGLFGLALSAKRLDAPFLAAITPYTLQTSFGIDSKVDEELQPGITISKPGPLAPLVSALLSMMQEAGKALQAAGARSLGHLVLDHLDGLVKAGKPLTAASLVQELADTIPGFQDSGLFTLQQPPPPGQPADASAAGGSQEQEQQQPIQAVFLRKAQALAAALHARFGSGEAPDSRFVFVDAAQLAADSGAVLPAVLRHLGLLSYSPRLAAALEQSQELPAGNDERALRAAAVAAADAVVAAAAGGAAGSTGAAGGPLTAHELSCYLLSQVAEAEGRLTFQGAVLRPHLTPGSIAY